MSFELYSGPRKQETLVGFWSGPVCMPRKSLMSVADSRCKGSTGLEVSVVPFLSLPLTCVAWTFTCLSSCKNQYRYSIQTQSSRQNSTLMLMTFLRSLGMLLVIETWISHSHSVLSLFSSTPIRTFAERVPNGVFSTSCKGKDPGLPPKIVRLETDLGLRLEGSI